MNKWLSLLGNVRPRAKQENTPSLPRRNVQNCFAEFNARDPTVQGKPQKSSGQEQPRTVGKIEVGAVQNPTEISVLQGAVYHNGVGGVYGGILLCFLALAYLAHCLGFAYGVYIHAK